MESGALGKTRTSNVLIRSQMLYLLNYERLPQGYRFMDAMNLSTMGATNCHYDDKERERLQCSPVDLVILMDVLRQNSEATHDVPTNGSETGRNNSRFSHQPPTA